MELFCSYSGFAETYIGRTIKSIADQFNTKFELQQLVEFQKAHKSELRASTRDVKQALEAAGNNVKWMEKNFENIWIWLQQQQRELVQYWENKLCSLHCTHRSLDQLLQSYKFSWRVCTYLIFIEIQILLVTDIIRYFFLI